MMLMEQLNSQVDLIRRLATHLDDTADGLARSIAETLGKPVRHAEVEVRRTSELILADVSRFLSQGDSVTAGSARVRWRPLGTVAVITPANNPVFIPLGKICVALLYGNSVIWKPAAETEVVSREIVRLIEISGCPPELFQTIYGGRTEAEQLLRNPQVAAVTMTASERSGTTARVICAERNIPLQAELGGNNASIVWRDADHSAAADAISRGAFEMAGQRCTANRRVIVLEEERESFLESLRAATRRMIWDDPLSRKADIGPLVSRSRCERVTATVDRAQRDCEHILHPLGLQPPNTQRFPGCWYPPTIVCCDDQEHEIVQEETFGPVLVVQSARDWEHAIELCNGVRQGLVAAIFTNSESTTQRFLEQAEAGMLKINQSTSDAEVDVPFCAWKASGYGPPKHGWFCRDFYSRPQTIYGEVKP